MTDRRVLKGISIMAPSKAQASEFQGGSSASPSDPGSLRARNAMPVPRSIVTRRAHVSINEMVVRPTEQSFGPSIGETETANGWKTRTRSASTM